MKRMSARGREMAHPDDVLIVGWEVERYGWPEFESRQVVSLKGVEHGGLRGLRPPRRVYVTDLVWSEADDRHWLDIQALAHLRATQSGYFNPHTIPVAKPAARWRLLGWLLDRIK